MAGDLGNVEGLGMIILPVFDCGRIISFQAGPPHGAIRALMTPLLDFHPSVSSARPLGLSLLTLFVSEKHPPNMFYFIFLPNRTVISQPHSV